MTNDIIKRLGYRDKIFINLVVTVRSRQKSISFPEISDLNLNPTFYAMIMKKLTYKPQFCKIIHTRRPEVYL